MHTDKSVVFPVATQRQAPTVDKVVGVPVVWQRQGPIIQTEQKTIDVPQIQCLEPLVDVPVVTQQTAEIPVVMPKQVPTFQKIQEPANDSQVQYNDKVVEVPVVMQRPVPSVQTAQKITEVPHIDTDKQVSPREIVSNAVDTFEKVRFHKVQDDSFPGDRKDTEIMVEHDQDAQTTSINVVDMPVVMRRQLSMIQVQKTVEVPQIQHVDTTLGADDPERAEIRRGGQGHSS